MTHQGALLREVIERPDDDAPRLIYADWLEEHGRPERAEFIRVQCALARMRDDDHRRERLRAREQHLLAEFAPDWRLPLPSGIRQMFRRGFVEGLGPSLRDFLERAEDLFRQTPLLHLQLPKVVTGNVPDLVRVPGLSRLRTLELHDNGLGDEGAAVLADARALAGLAALLLPATWEVPYVNRLHAAGVAALARSPHLTRLVRLELQQNAIGDGGLAALAGAPTLRGLKVLNVADNDIGMIGDGGVTALVESPHLRALTVLNLRGNPLGDTGAEALAAWPGLARLAVLNLESCEIDNRGARVLAASPYINDTVRVALRANDLDEAARSALRARLGDRVTL